MQHGVIPQVAKVVCIICINGKMGQLIKTTLYPTLHVIKGKYFYFTPLYLLFDGILEINTRKSIKMFRNDQG